MDLGNDPFQPDQIDEQIEKLLQRTDETTQHEVQDSMLVQNLQHYYIQKRQEETLKRAWGQISQRYDNNTLSSATHSELHYNQSERNYHHSMQQTEKQTVRTRRISPRWTILAAAVVLVFLSGTVFLILNQTIQTNKGPAGGGNPTPPPACFATPTPTPKGWNPAPTPTPAPSLPTEASATSTPSPTPTVVGPCPTYPPTPTPTSADPPQNPTPTPVPPGATPSPTPTPLPPGVAPSPTPEPTGGVIPPTPTPLPPGAAPSPTPTPAPGKN